MRVCVLGVAAMLLGLLSCSPKKTDVVRVNTPRYSLVTDSLFTRMPGSLFYQQGIVYWQDVFSSEGFMHAVDASTGKEWCRFGTMGNGPKDFTFPLLSVSVDGGFYINDLEKELEIFYQPVGEQDSLHIAVGSYQRKPDVTRLVRLNNGELLYFTPYEEVPFHVCKGDTWYSGGKYPLQEQIANAYDIFQGNVLYNPQNACVVYSTLRYPYLAVYRVGDGKLSLEKELEDPASYRIQEGNLIIDGKQTAEGAMELALTSNHIVTLQRDVVTEGEKPKSSSPLDLAVLPRSLFVYDYALELTKIITLPFPVLRICGDTESNVVYIIGANPEFGIYQLNLDEQSSN